VKAVERGEPDCLVVTGETMQEAINLVRWFVAEAERVYGMLSEDPAATARRRLVEYIVGKGGTMTARKLSQGPRAYRGDAERARAELDELVDLGLARREEQQTGGRPSTLYTLVVASQEVSPGDESPAESVEKDIRSRSHPPDAMCVDGVELPRGRSGSDDGHDPGTRRMEQHSAGAHPRGATATEATQDTADGGFVADQAERDETWRG
jgi:hypothetical protein